MARLVKVPGIVIQASGVRAKATRITIQCRSCRTYQAGIAVKPGLEGYSLPRKCLTYVTLFMYILYVMHILSDQELKLMCIHEKLKNL